MKLVKVTCEIRYAERMKVLGSYEALYRDLLKKEPTDVQRWPVPGLKLDDSERKRVMVVDPNRSVIDVQQPPNVGFCKDMVLQFFRNVNEKLVIPAVVRWGLRTTWIQEYDGQFSDLLLAYKKQIFGGSLLVGRSDDVGAVLDYFIDDNIKLSLTTGPMKLQQLKEQFLAFEPEGISPVFIYTDIDMGDTKTTTYSERYLSEFFTRALDEGERLASEVIKQVGGET